MGIILASASPRRLEILKEHGIDPIVMPTEADESLSEGISPEIAVKTLSERKARVCFEMIKRDPELSAEYSDCLIIGADTIVWKDEILGKPEDKDDAFRMLDMIRGTDNQVLTGVCLIDIKTCDIRSICDITNVYCTDYSDEDINDYISREEPYDKAGSYAIQGYFSRYIDHIDGDYENVIGLPYYRIADILEKYV